MSSALLGNEDMQNELIYLRLKEIAFAYAKEDSIPMKRAKKLIYCLIKLSKCKK